MYERTYDLIQRDGQRIAHEYRHAHLAYSLAVEALSSEVEEVCSFWYLHAWKLVRIPCTIAADEVGRMLILVRHTSVCVACVVRFPVLSHLRVTDTSCGFLPPPKKSRAREVN